MRRISELKGLPILTYDTGKRIGEVKDTLYSLEQRHVVAFLVDEGGWSPEARVVPFEQVISIGRDSILVPHERVMVKVSESPEVKGALESRRLVTSMRAYAEGGQYLGTVQDAVVDEPTGDIKGYELSGATWEEMREGRHFVPVPEAPDIGEQAM